MYIHIIILCFLIPLVVSIFGFEAKAFLPIKNTHESYAKTNTKVTKKKSIVNVSGNNALYKNNNVIKKLDKIFLTRAALKEQTKRVPFLLQGTKTNVIQNVRKVPFLLHNIKNENDSNVKKTPFLSQNKTGNTKSNTKKTSFIINIAQADTKKRYKQKRSNTKISENKQPEVQNHEIKQLEVQNHEIKQPDVQKFEKKQNTSKQFRNKSLIAKESIKKNQVKNVLPLTQSIVQSPTLSESVKFISDAHAENTLNVIKLEFEKTKTKIATFKKSGWIWFVFEGKTKTNLSETLQPKFNNDFKILLNEKYTIFKIKSEQIPKIIQSANAYTLDFSDKNNSTLNKTIIKALDSVFSIPFTESMTLVDIYDEDSLEKMKVVLVENEENSIKINYHYPHFRVIPAEFGIVFVQIADGVNFTNENNFINVRFPKFFSIKHKSVPVGNPIFEFCSWYFGDDFYHTNLRLANEIINANKDEKLEKQIDLVKFYLAHNMLKEAIWHLEYIKKHNLNSIYDNEFLLLYGAALYLSDLSSEAYSMFSSVNTSLLNEEQLKELDFWKHLIKIKNNTDGLSVEQYYKNVSCNHLHYNNIAITLFKSEVGLGINAKKISETYDAIKVLKLNDYQIDDIFLTFAKFMLYSGNNVKAIETLSKLSENFDNPKIRAEAMLEKVKHLVDTYVISIKEAIDTLNSIIIIWHGKDLLEGKILTELAQNYFADHQYYKGLLTLNSINNDPEIRKSLFLDIGKKMKDMFWNVFYDPKISNTIDSFEKVKIFLAFDNLVPIGVKGIDLSFKFIDHLLNLNMVNSAISILEHLITFRLDGAEKNKAVTMVENLYLDSKEYNKVITSIEDWKLTQTEELSLIKSKAYIGMNNYLKAEEALENYNSEKSNYIRTYIYWNSGNALKMKQFIEPKLHIRNDPSSPLSELEKLFVLYLSNAYVLLNEKENFESLYSSFAKMLKQDNQYYEIISMLNTIINVNNIDKWNTIQKSLDDLLNMKMNFMPNLT